ncbi:hypothetical protein [Sphingobium sp. EM0848]|uniref:hypothetical protein n=1 Tax=Sphingobium sp. EM0848 TaxID=2743473 RepID=UPI00159C3055|nr:hypothetical protein [Sphingobium sp. EM0848]
MNEQDHAMLARKLAVTHRTIGTRKGDAALPAGAGRSGKRAAGKVRTSKAFVTHRTHPFRQ